MRRIRDRRPSRLFRGSELPRLLTMVVMLGVLVLLVGLARDPKTWRWMSPAAPEDSAEGQALAEHQQDVVGDDPATGGPTDEDPQEIDAAREEFEAVTDKSPLAKEESPAYWRLMRWQQHQTIEQLRRRANKDVTFRQLWQEPEKWRGKLVQIPLHLRRTAKINDLAENDLGLKSTDEVWGWNSDSQPYWYWLVLAQLPPGMPQGASIYEEATFVGYFLKLLPYEDHQGVTRATPLLIGRLIWHPAGPNPLAPSGEWTWPWYLAGVLAVIFVVRWGLFFSGRRAKTGGGRGLPSATDQRTVEDWLERAEEPEGDRNRESPA